MLFLYLFGVFCLQWQEVFTVTPTGVVQLDNTIEIYAAAAAFGSSLPTQYSSSSARLLEPYNELTGCTPTVVKYYPSSSFVLLVARGSCSFESKAAAAYLLGAKGLIVYNSLEGIYGGLNYSSPSDYECDNGAGYVKNLVYPLYTSAMNDLMPESCTKDPKCASGRCVVTNDTVTLKYGHRVCCAWDLYATMGADDFTTTEPKLPVVSVRMQDYDILAARPDLTTQTLRVRIYARSALFSNASMVIVYFLAVLTVVYASYRSAEKDRILNSYDENENSTVDAGHGQQEFPRSSTIDGASTGHVSDYEYEEGGGGDYSDEYESRDEEGDTEYDLLSQGLPSTYSTRANSYNGSTDGFPGRDRYSTSSSQSYNMHTGLSRLDMKTTASTPRTDPNKLEISARSAFFYFFFCSFFLCIMYYFSVSSALAIIYLLLAGVAIYLLVFFPFFEAIARVLFSLRTGRPMSDYKLVGASEGGSTLSSSLFSWESTFSINSISVLAMLVTVLLIANWYYIRESDSYIVWLGQDMMGMLVAVFCLDMLQLPNLQVAVVLLMLAFCYDIFFVFGSDYFFKTSLMEQVAIGTQPTLPEENYCEKYPHDKNYCILTTLPMMLYVPALEFFTFDDTDAILGLGDMILPGLLTVWAARHDIRKYGTVSLTNWHVGYYSLSLMGYMMGLLLADLFVIYFATGQPALMYVVPCMLLPILTRAYRSDTLSALWYSLPAMKVVALPMTQEEQAALLTDSAAVQVEAEWAMKTSNIFVVDSALVEGAGAVKNNMADSDSHAPRHDKSQKPKRQQQGTRRPGMTSASGQQYGSMSAPQHVLPPGSSTSKDSGPGRSTRDAAWTETKPSGVAASRGSQFTHRAPAPTPAYTGTGSRNLAPLDSAEGLIRDRILPAPPQSVEPSAGPNSPPPL